MTITWNYVIVECDCERSQIAVKDNNDEDCNLWDCYNVIRYENKVCTSCGKLPAVNVSYAVPPANPRLQADATDEAVESGQVTLVTLGELVQMLNSLGNIVIEAASKGYVSSNDLDFANDCLEKVIPLLP